MHKSIPMIFAVLVLFILSLCSACVSQSQPNQTSGQNTGLTRITVPPDSYRVSFEEAQQKLKEYRAASFNKSSIPSDKLYYILANDVDDQGRAKIWAFGVNQENGSHLFIYDKAGWTDTPLSSSELPLEEIVADRILHPDTIFSENKAAIIVNPPSSNAELRELELKEGIYTLKLSSGSTVKVLKFNATTGTLIV